jgi:hypothetical protein
LVILNLEEQIRGKIMSNRFHNKYHANSHHTNKSDGYIDSASDPIASHEHPFNGDLVISGDISAISPNSVIHVDTVDAHTINTDDMVIENIEADTISTNTLSVNAISDFVMDGDLNLNGYTLIGGKLSDMDDVNVSSVSNGEVLTYDSGVWRGSTASVSQATTLSYGTVKYATDAEAINGVLETKVINPKQLKTAMGGNIIDVKYVPITSTGTGEPDLVNIIDSVGIAEFTYDISKLQGSGLSNNHIRNIYIVFESTNSQRDVNNSNISYGYVTFPDDDVNYKLVYANGMVGYEDAGCMSRDTFILPINSGQTTFKIKIEIEHSSGYFAHISSSIIGASQLVYG